MSGKRLVLIIIAVIVVLLIVVAAALVWHFMSTFGELATGTYVKDEDDFQTYKTGLIEAIKEIEQHNDRCNMIQSAEEFDALYLEIQTASENGSDGILGKFLGSMYIRHPEIRPLIEDAMDEAQQFQTCMVRKSIPSAIESMKDDL